MTLLYNGIQYEIEDEGDIEKVNNAGIGEDENDAFFVPADEFRESAWEPKNVHLFLDECIRRKTELRDPKVRRRKIFSDISERMKLHGYYFRVESLDRKLRNMKIHYLVSRQNNKKSLKRTHWPYYDKMKMIYPDASSAGRKRAASPISQTQDSNSPPPLPAAHEIPSPSSSPLPSPPAYKMFRTTEINTEQGKRSQNHLPDNEDQPINNTRLENPNKLESLRKQILSFEERRTVAAEKILNELREANRLKKEILELNIKIFKAERALQE